MVRPFAHRLIYPARHILMYSQQHNDFLSIFKVCRRFVDIDGFFYGFLTKSEMEMFITRWQIVKWLWTTDLTSQIIARNLKVSTRTITFVAERIQSKCHQGFTFVLMMRFGATHRQAWKELRA
jgi:Trp operon repressor